MGRRTPPAAQPLAAASLSKYRKSLRRPPLADLGDDSGDSGVTASEGQKRDRTSTNSVAPALLSAPCQPNPPDELRRLDRAQSVLVDVVLADDGGRGNVGQPRMISVVPPAVRLWKAPAKLES